MGLAHIAKEQNRIATWRTVGINIRCAAGQTTERISGYGSAGRGTIDVEVITAYQQVTADRAGIASGEQNIARELTFNIAVILVNPAGLEVGRLIVEHTLE